ncbi:FAD-dependent oxidoreductase, partial [archaeon]
MTSSIDTVVIGAGITGLLIARSLSSLYGIKVLVVEATDKVGGHIQKLPHTLLQHLDLEETQRPYSYPNSKFVARKHRLLHDEILRYRNKLHIVQVSASNKVYVQSRILGNITWKEYFTTIKSHAKYAYCTSKIDSNANNIVPEQGFHQIAYDHLDMPWSTYIQQELQLTKENPTDQLMYEFLAYLPYAVLQAYSEEISAVMLLYMVCLFHGVGNLLTFIFNFESLEEGFAGLLDCIYQECVNLKVDFMFNKPVIEVGYEHTARVRGRIPD